MRIKKEGGSERKNGNPYRPAVIETGGGSSVLREEGSQVVLDANPSLRKSGSVALNESRGEGEDGRLNLPLCPCSGGDVRPS